MGIYLLYQSKTYVANFTQLQLSSIFKDIVNIVEALFEEKKTLNFDICVV